MLFELPRRHSGSALIDAVEIRVVVESGLKTGVFYGDPLPDQIVETEQSAANNIIPETYADMFLENAFQMKFTDVDCFCNIFTGKWFCKVRVGVFQYLVNSGRVCGNVVGGGIISYKKMI